MVSEEADPRHRPYGHQADGIWTQDGTIHKRDEDLAKTTIYGSEPREDCDVSSPVPIGAIKMTNSNRSVQDQSNILKAKEKEIAIDRGDSIDAASDR